MAERRIPHPGPARDSGRRHRPRLDGRGGLSCESGERIFAAHPPPPPDAPLSPKPSDHDLLRGPLRITAQLSVPAHELAFHATRAGGPGGQHVNTSSTRVELSWCVATSGALTDAQRDRLLTRLASRLDTSGTLRIVSAETRSQHQNRVRALARLAETVAAALVVPKVRKKTRPTRGSVEERLSAKRRQTARKADRRWRGEE